MRKSGPGQSPHILVLSPGVADAKRASEKARFASLIEALGAAGVFGSHAFVDSPESLESLIAATRPDIAFSSFFRFDSGAYLREALIAEGVAWIGSTSEVLELALSKSRMKARWRLHGIPTPEWHVIRRNKDGSIDGIEFIEGMRDFPYIVKPANEGNSRGIDAGSVVRSSLELYARASLIADEFGDVLVERFVSGGADSREFTVALIGNGTRSIVSGVEICKAEPGALLITEEDKEQQTTLVAPIEERKLKEKVERLAVRIFVASGARDYARCDILLHEGKLYAIEMNGQPMVPDRWFEACAREAGLDSRQYPCAIALAGIEGNAETGHAFIPIPRDMKKILPPLVFERLAR
jgi:D-alanine-D-alanine ligase